MFSPHRLDPYTCDLCGSSEHRALIDGPTARAMRSDQAVVPRRLKKRTCATCGLARSGEEVSGETLTDYYSEDYALGLPPEHEFYGRTGPVPRSAVFADWLSSAAPDAWVNAQRVLEVGAGGGRLIAELGRRFSDRRFEGLEPSRAAVERARALGLAVWASTLEDFREGPYDLIYSVAVIEHVPSPSRFLGQIRARLREGGWLLLCQPTQDVPSYDVFFVDHLHHFGTAHLHGYAKKSGFREEVVAVGYEFMPNFSLHAWRAVSTATPFRWDGPAAATTCAATVNRISSDIARLDALIDDLRARGRRVAVFGVREVYWLLRAYSRLGDFPVVCGLDDQPDQPGYKDLGFPVMKPEACVSEGVQDVILAMNKIYYEAAGARLARLGLVAHPVLS